MTASPGVAGEPTVVLLHGAGMGTWVWDRVIAALGMPALALDVPGRTADATPARCADALAGSIEQRTTGPVVLVAHSLAGVLLPDLTRLLQPRGVRIVPVAAVIPAVGSSFVSTLPFVNRLVLRTLFRFRPAGLLPSPAMIRAELCNDLDDADTRMVVERYQPEYPGLYLTPVSHAVAPCDGVYVHLAKDQSVTPPQQAASAARLGDPEVRVLDAGHLAMLSQPQALAEIIRDVARRRD